MAKRRTPQQIYAALERAELAEARIGATIPPPTAETELNPITRAARESRKDGQ